MAGLTRFIFIYGPPGVGKSKTGRILADSLEMPFYDLDNEIEIQANRSISEIFFNEGQEAFRKRESLALEEVLQKTEGIVSLGGGALLNEENHRIASEKGAVVFLDADIQVIQDRLAKDSSERPLLQEKGKLEELLNNRKSHYDSFEYKIDTYSHTPEEVAWEIQKRIGRYLITGMGKNYPVYVQANSLDNIGQILKDHRIDKNVAVITDQNVANYYQETVLSSLKKSGYKTSLIIIPPGEDSKNLEMLSHIWGQLLEDGHDRKSTIISLGGGVIGDLAGFAAATFLRGIDWVGIPTSLLAMVDSSLGGKTGIDLPQGKNLAGAFHPPKMALVDPLVLSTLPEAEIKNGLAEVIKHGIISDPDLFNTCALGLDNIQENWTQIIRQAMGVKVKIIQEDPYEQGIRATLNLGHTIGHAVEALSEFSIRHGEAVAIGMFQEAKLSENLGLAEKDFAKKIKTCLLNVDLPTEIPDSINAQQLLHAMKFDKKRADGKLLFALPIEIGTVKAGIVIDDLEDQLQNLKENK